VKLFIDKNKVTIFVGDMFFISDLETVDINSLTLHDTDLGLTTEIDKVTLKKLIKLVKDVEEMERLRGGL
jgi:hypothetical protein